MMRLGWMLVLVGGVAAVACKNAEGKPELVVAPSGCEGLHREPRTVQPLPSTAEQHHVLEVADPELPLLGPCHDLPPNDPQP